ncbi:MAG: hypothetical protein AAF483_19135 [Planctomycetota bacterium]
MDLLRFSNRFYAVLCVALLTVPVVCLGQQQSAVQGAGETKLRDSKVEDESESELYTHPDYQTRNVQGWTVLVHEQLLKGKKAETEKAIRLLEEQLQVIQKRVPAKAVDHLQSVKLWFSPKYDGSRPGAEYHPGAGWLERNGRIPELVKCVEFTNVDIFEKECVRMPMLALHELAHAYHDQVLGFEHAGIRSTFDEAAKSGIYDTVERWFGPHRKNTREKAYGITNHKEYFAEGSEAFFGRNDFFPFTKQELERHDPKFAKLLAQLWGIADE